MQWDDKEFTQNVYFWTPNSEILAKALLQTKPKVGVSRARPVTFIIIGLQVQLSHTRSLIQKLALSLYCSFAQLTARQNNAWCKTTLV